MLVTREFVFVHIPRTGGSTIRAVLADHADPNAPIFPTHAAYDELPQRLRDRPAFCVVRNPWDWYVSWYHNGLRNGQRLSGLHPGHPKRQIWESAFNAGESTFAEAITRACNGQLNHPLASVARKRDVDLYSAHVRTQAGPALKRGDLDAGRFEQLVPFLLDYISGVGALDNQLRHAFERTPPVNASEHGSYRDYYDDTLRDLIARKARWLIERYAYAF